MLTNSGGLNSAKPMTSFEATKNEAKEAGKKTSKIVDLIFSEAPESSWTSGKEIIEDSWNGYGRF
ncbi:hypothetical protein DSCOOX_12610 [Desulfosarcina ovata subsp. ovata]|uniref:Uncharacterized protein n=1 Tax=Desulfosarcina ovata subsp. ovata TaxID=2752305 RepID=A0A5K8A6I7_9BACT|nr:hypothetical protein DSCOOX_12610 [Desulfosarcina ovata subsp. ovata]